jgi:hypothetical protein
MASSFRVLKPGEIEMELTVSMPLAAWKKLREELPDGWPATDLRYQITLMVNKAERHFWPAEEPAP